MTLRFADALSASRLVLAVPFALAVVHERTAVAAACVAWAADSDVVDGRVARARGGAPHGRAVDAWSDAVFLLAGAGALVAVGRAPWSLPALMVVAFAPFALVLARGAAPRPDRVGRHLGAGLYVVVALSTLLPNPTAARWAGDLGALALALVVAVRAVRALNEAARTPGPSSGRPRPHRAP